MQFELDGNRYSITSMGVFDQLKVARKLVPVFSTFAADYQDIAAAQDGSQAIQNLLPKVAEAVAEIKDEDFDYIMAACLKVIFRETVKNNWQPVMRGGELMFDDIKSRDVITLIARVIGDNLGDFLPEVPTSETPTQQADAS